MPENPKERAPVIITLDGDYNKISFIQIAVHKVLKPSIIQLSKALCSGICILNGSPSFS